MEITNIFLETQNFHFFKENVLKYEDYMEISKGKSKYNHLAKTHVPYMLVYDTFRCIRQEQRAIIENCEDSAILSKAFRELSNLRQLRLEFCQTLFQGDWVAFYMDRTISENSVRHHFQVISNALKVGRDSGAFIQTIHLLDLEMPYFSSFRLDPSFQVLGVHLRDLLKCVSNLCLSGSGSVLKLLACIDLDLQHLELCQFTIHQAAFHEFMQRHTCSVSSIECHEVRFILLKSTVFGMVGLSSELCESLLREKSSLTLPVKIG